MSSIKSKTKLNATDEKQHTQEEQNNPEEAAPLFESWRTTPPLTGQARLDAITRFKEFIASQAGRYPEGYEVDLSRE